MKNARILLIEDEQHNIQTVSTILKEHGYQISVAIDGRQGLALLERFRPDLILLDVMMPGIDGFEVCRRIKESPVWRDIPIIFLTAMTEPQDVVDGFKAGAVDYLPKPFNAHELVARVRARLEFDQVYRQKQPGIIAEAFNEVSVLFADIVGFTHLSSQMPPADLLDLLNRVFSCFDELVEQHGLEKIKTIGDTYMAAGGLPEPHHEHLSSIAETSLQMLDGVGKIPCDYGRITVRAGLHVGPVVAGVIRSRKSIDDIWGGTVKTAGRLQSTGRPGRVHVSKAVVERLKDRFVFESGEPFELEGQGPAETFYLAKPIGL
jgi:adenylate cyclase